MESEQREEYCVYWCYLIRDNVFEPELSLLVLSDGGM